MKQLSYLQVKNSLNTLCKEVEKFNDTQFTVVCSQLIDSANKLIYYILGNKHKLSEHLQSVQLFHYDWNTGKVTICTKNPEVISYMTAIKAKQEPENRFSFHL